MRRHAQCDYQIRGERQCRNGAAWTVAFITPDDGQHMRRRRTENRCFWHADERFFPQGTTGITTQGFATREAAPSTP
jgi:hypothetical protein